MKKPLKAFAAAAILILSFATAAAQNAGEPDETGVLQSGIDELAQRLNRQEKTNAKWEKVLAALPKISGYVQAGYRYGGDAHDYTSNFYIPSVRLSLAGDLGRKVDYKFQFEFMNPKLIDAYVRYKICPGFSLQAGQFHTNFSLEGPMSPLDMEAIDYAPIVDAVACKSPDTRDIGIAAYGAAARRDGFSIFEYCVGVYNGEGKNKADANKSKNVVARVKVNPVKEFTLSGSFGFGDQGENYVHNTRYAAGAWWHGERFYARAEYLALHRHDRAADFSRGDDISGCYVVTGVWIKRFCPLARYNFMESRLGGGSPVRQSDWLVGLDYKPLKYLRLQLNYTRTHYNGRGGANIAGVVVTGVF